MFTVTEHVFIGRSVTLTAASVDVWRRLLFRGRTGANANLSSPIYNSVRGNVSNSPKDFNGLGLLAFTLLVSCCLQFFSSASLESLSSSISITSQVFCFFLLGITVDRFPCCCGRWERERLRVSIFFLSGLFSSLNFLFNSKRLSDIIFVCSSSTSSSSSSSCARPRVERLRLEPSWGCLFRIRMGCICCKLSVIESPLDLLRSLRGRSDTCWIPSIFCVAGEFFRITPRRWDGGIPKVPPGTIILFEDDVTSGAMGR
mmetsp:Transcript_50/g.101  ORF Transcript_50/g.101 Transcript_50/m.101 type:complete len:258 (+) Transcript_50:575-1348(+)